MTEAPPPAPSLLRASLAAVLTGLLLAAAFPGPDIGWLAFVALIPLLWAWRAAGPGRAAVLGFIAGVAFFGVHLWWAVYFGAVAVVPFVAFEAVYWAGCGAVLGGLGRLRVRSPWVTAAAWVVFEAVRTRWPLGGFAWAQVGAALHNLEPMRALASWGGVPLVTFLVVAFNCLLLDFAMGWRSSRESRTRVRLMAAGGLVAILLIVIVGTAARFDPTPTGTLRVAMLQGNDQDRYLSQDEVDSGYLTRKHLELAAKLHGRYDLIVFPESALESDPEDDPILKSDIVALARKHHSAVMLNVVDEQTPGKRYNANRLYDARGALRETYAKQHLVPFGEYVPWRDQLSFVDELKQIPSDFDPGHKTKVAKVAGHPVGTVICFESAFGPLMRASSRDGAQAIVVTTNNRSYRRSPNSAQHLALTQMNAAAIGRPVVHASISGISAIIDETGTVREHTRLFHNQVVTARIATMTGETPYVRFGDWVEWGSLIGLLGALAYGLRRRRLARLANTRSEP